MKFYKNLSEIKAENLFIAFLLILITPFIFLFYFNHPSADDFGLAMNTKMYGFEAAQSSYYKFWGGKFFSNAVLSYNPLYFNSMAAYKVTSFIIMVIFLLMLFKLIKDVTGSSLNSREKLLITLSITFLYLYAMPSVSQSFYWITASIVYQLGIILIMMFLLLYIRLIKAGNLRTKIFYTILSTIILIAIAGCSEIAMTITLIIMGLLILNSLFTERKIKWPLIVFALFLAAASYVVVTAPGNQVRAEVFQENRQFFYSFYYSMVLLLQKMFSWVFLSPIIPITVLILPVIFKLIRSKRSLINFSINPLYSLIIFFISLYLLMFIPVWSTGKDPYSRTLNLIYFIFLIGWFYNVIVIVSYFDEKFNFKSRGIPKYVYAFAVLLILVFLVKRNNVRVAFADLLRGTAYKYDNELEERYSYIRSNSSDSIVVDDIKSIPRTIYVADISSDPNMLANQMYARYFNKKSITLKKSDDKP